MKKIPLDVLEEKARVLTREALREHPRIPDHLRKDLTLGMFVEGSARIFQLYIAADRPEDATIVTRVSIDSQTGEASPVEVFPEAWRDAIP